MNRVTLIGNVGADPVIRYLDTGICLASVRLATTERGYTLPNGTQVPEQTEWHDVVVWRKQAEYLEKHLHKGDRLFVEGKIHTRFYDDKQGQRRKAIEIMADYVEIIATPHRQGQPEAAARVSQDH